MEIILVIDVGNTNIKFAVYQQEKQLSFHKVNTKEKHNFQKELSFVLNNGEIQPNCCVFVSVVPSINTQIQSALDALSIQTFVISTAIKTNLHFNDVVQNELGNDLLCMAAYSHHKFKTELLALSLGTASAIIHITGDGEIKHSLIFPGLKSGAKNLFESAEQLDEIDLDSHTELLALDTKSALKSGITYAYVGSIKYIIQEYKRLIHPDIVVVASGGMSSLVKQYCQEIDYCDRDLVMKGALYLYSLNRNENCTSK